MEELINKICTEYADEIKPLIHKKIDTQVNQCIGNVLSRELNGGIRTQLLQYINDNLERIVVKVIKEYIKSHNSNDLHNYLIRCIRDSCSLQAERYVLENFRFEAHRK